MVLCDFYSRKVRKTQIIVFIIAILWILLFYDVLIARYRALRSPDPFTASVEMKGSMRSIADVWRLSRSRMQISSFWPITLNAQTILLIST